MALRGNPVALSGTQWHSVALSALSGTPWHSAATSGQQRRTASKMALKTTRLERLSDESDSKAVNRSRARPVNAGPPEAHAWRAAPKSTCAKGATRGHQGGHQGGHQTQIRRHSAHLIRLHAARKHLIPELQRLLHLAALMRGRDGGGEAVLQVLLLEDTARGKGGGGLSSGGLGSGGGGGLVSVGWVDDVE